MSNDQLVLAVGMLCFFDLMYLEFLFWGEAAGFKSFPLRWFNKLFYPNKTQTEAISNDVSDWSNQRDISMLSEQVIIQPYDTQADIDRKKSDALKNLYWNKFAVETENKNLRQELERQGKNGDSWKLKIKVFSFFLLLFHMVIIFTLLDRIKG